jgi:hypothetical protein
MEPEVIFGQWYEIDGPWGTEFLPADLVGKTRVTHPDGRETQHQPGLDELQEWDRLNGLLTEEDDTDSVRFPIPSALRDYCENKEAWRIDLIEGWGARLSMPGYLDCTSWTVCETEEEARAYLEDTYGDDEEES